MLIEAHENGIFMVSHPKSSDIILLDWPSFYKLFNIKEEMKTAFEAEIKSVLAKTDCYITHYDDYNVTHTKSIGVVSAYCAFCKPKIFRNGDIN